MKTTIKAMLLTAALLVPASVLAQKPAIRGAEMTATYTITKINKATRTVTLKDKDGLVDDVYCGPDILRFDEFKVGDKVNFRYYESLVTLLSKPGTAPKPAVSSAMTRNSGAPGATFSQQMVATVTIVAMDASAAHPSITVKTADGIDESFEVQDPKNLTGYKAGDKVDVTYTQALAISVTK